MSQRLRLSSSSGRPRWAEVHPDAAAAARRAADLVEEVLRATPDSNLILPAGGTPVPIFRELIRRSVEEGLDLSQFHLFQLDELEGVRSDDQRSFNAFLRRSLLDELDRAEDLNHLLDGCAADPAAQIEAHAALLQERGGAQLALLGLGLNGHVGYNEPGSIRDAPARRVDLDESTLCGLRQQFRDRPVPARGVTLGLRELRAARRVVIVATGKSKAEIVQACLDADPVSRLPASWLHDHPELRWVLDVDAASRLARSAAAGEG